MTDAARGRAAKFLLASALLLAGSLILFFPGVAMYDTVRQYAQVLAGEYDDWHPPAMARLWAAVAPLGPGAAPMLALQLAGYWLGLGMMAAALGASGRRRSAAAMLGVGLLPPFLGWQGVVVKDAQLVGALLALVGAVGWWCLRGRRTPWAAVVALAPLATYAVLVRANAVFAVVPLLVMLSPWPRRAIGKALLGIGAAAAVLAIAPTVNHRVFDAWSSGVERTQAMYDLAGIAVRTADPADAGLTAAERQALVAKHCWSPFFWDALGDDAHCGGTVARWRGLPVARLYVLLANAALRHPLAYAGARSSHLNSTERWLVPADWPDGAPPAESEVNGEGLGSPGAAARGWNAIAAAVATTPLGWPAMWVTLAMGALAAALARPGDAVRRMALALLASALTLEASFAVLSIASDLRYHSWPMIATGVAVVLLADRWPPRRTAAIGGAALIAVIAAGLAARLLLPPAPATYRGMLDGATDVSIGL